MESGKNRRFSADKWRSFYVKLCVGLARSCGTGVLPVELRHCSLYADMDKAIDYLRGTVNQGGEVHQLVIIEAAEHVIHLVAFREIIADAETEARVPLAAA